MHGVGSKFLKFLLLFAVSRNPLSVAAADTDTKAATTTTSGLQTNFGDVSFAGGMSYDSDHQILYVTGQVGPHSCFVGVLKRVAATKQSSGRPTHLEFLSRQVFDERAICQTIAFRKDVSRPGNALLLSLSEEGGLLTDQRVEGSRKAKQYGGLLALEYSADGSSSEFDPDKSVLMYPAAVTVPRSITNDPIRTNRVFVATMTSDSTSVEYRDALGSPHVSEGGGGGVTTKPNLTPGGGMLKYGKNFAMTIESIRLSTEFSDAEPQWRKPFGVKRSSDSVTRNGVTVNQILFRQGSQQEDKDDDNENQALFVVGSTLGSGPAFGEPEFDNDKGYGLVAGFITKLDPDTGSLTASRRFLYNLNESSKNNETDLRDTYIEAICDSTDEEDAIYVVGSYDRFKNADRSRFLQTEGIPNTFVPTFFATLSFSSGGYPPGAQFGDDDNFDDDENFDDDNLVQDDDDRFKRSSSEDKEEESSEDSDINSDNDNNVVGEEDEETSSEDEEGGSNEDDDSGEVSHSNIIATPYIAKLRASTLETIWQKDFESTANARALGCGIDPKSKALYVAGNIENGGELAGQTTSLLGDDVFLLQLDNTDGEISWSKQLGTSNDDRLAYGGSGLVVLEGQQGVLLMGDTTGGLYSVSSQDSEIFIAEVDADGNLPDTTENTGIDNSPSEHLVDISNPTQVGSTEQSDVSTKPLDPVADDSVEPSEDDVESLIMTGSKLYAFLSLCFVAFACLGCFMHVSEKRKRKARERALVFSYLQGFDLEDVDVKQAATGGWHGTYMGSLADGLNGLENEARSSSDGSWDSGNEYNSGNEVAEQKLRKLSHSSLVRDILFMDYDDTVFSSVNADKSQADANKEQERDGILRDPVEIIDMGEEEDERKVDPWGTEII